MAKWSSGNLGAKVGSTRVGAVGLGSVKLHGIRLEKRWAVTFRHSVCGLSVSNG